MNNQTEFRRSRCLLRCEPAATTRPVCLPACLQAWTKIVSKYFTGWSDFSHHCRINATRRAVQYSTVPCGQDVITSSFILVFDGRFENQADIFVFVHYELFFHWHTSKRLYHSNLKSSIHTFG